MKRRKLVPLLVIAAGLLAYHNSFTGKFICDDVGSILENPTIRHLWPLWQPLSPPHRGGLTVEGRPLINLSLAINYALGGYNVWGYHALNLAVHILAGLTLFGIVRRTLLQPLLRACFGAAADVLALATAVLWTVHPLQTESVTYVIQRAESIMGLFYLLTLYCFIRGTGSVPVQSPVGTRFIARAIHHERSTASIAAQQLGPTGSAARSSVLWFALSVTACALGMACKEVMVTAPVMVLLYDRAFLTSSFREAWRRRWPLYLALATTWILLGYLSILTLSNASMNARRIGLTWWQYLLTEPGVILYYLRLAVWPHPLCFDFYGWPIANTWVRILPPAAGIVVLLGASASAWRTKPAWGFVGAWFFLILAPSSSFVPAHDAIYEHRLYLSLAAVISLVVIGLYSVAGRRSLAVFAAVAIGLGFLTWRRNLDYRSEIAMRFDAVAKIPNSPLAHYNLGVALSKAGRPREAIAHYEQALRIDPNLADAHNNLGTDLLQEGKLGEATAHYEQALQIEPTNAQAHFNLGVALEQSGRRKEAMNQYQQALEINPDFAQAHGNFGNALLDAGRIEEAIDQYRQALRINPDYADAHNNLGGALLRVGRIQEAVEQFDQALRITPDLIETHYNLGVVLEQMGKTNMAIEHYEQVVRLNPNYAEARNRLARLQTAR